MFIQWILILHVASVVAWFAGMFYLGRLFVYHREAYDKPEPDSTILKKQFEVMEYRLWRYITLPAAHAALLFGLILAWKFQDWLQPWFHIKLTFVFLLFAFNIGYAILIRKLKVAAILSSKKFRLLNEVPTFFLLVILSVVYLKSNWISSGAPLYLLTVVVLIAGITLLIKRK